MKNSLNKVNIEIIKQSLNDLPDIIGKTKYLNSAVIIPLVNLKDEIHLLFEKRSANVRQAGEISFPGGHFDTSKDKTLLDTAIRETIEELGISSKRIELISKFGTLVAPMGLTIDAFAAQLRINSLDDLKIDSVEVEKIFTIPLNYFLTTEPQIFYSRLEIHTIDNDQNGKITELLPVKKLGLPEYYANPWRNGRYRVIVYNTKPDVLWGLTAEIVYEFVRALMKEG